MFRQGLEYKIILGYRSVIFAYRDLLIPFLQGNTQILASL